MKMSIVQKINKKVTEGIINCLEKGVVPWNAGYISALGIAKNFKGVAYRGINRWICYASVINNKFPCNTWITFNQCRNEKGHILKGSKATTIVFWNFKGYASKKCNKCLGQAKSKDECKCFIVRPMLKSFSVFNLSQTSLWEEKSKEIKEEVVEVETNTALAEQLISQWKNEVPVKYGYDNLSTPFYAPLSDFINIPYGKGVKWENEEMLHKVTFHEMIHSTGAENRLDRFDKAVLDGTGADKLHNRGQYSAEELVAEMGSQILSDICGFKQEHLENTSSYINSWIKCLKGNTDWIVWAGTRAEKGVDMILNKSIEKE